MTLQAARILDVRTFGILRPYGITHPLLVPRGLVHPIIMAATIGDRGFVKFGMEQNRRGRILAPGGIAVNSNSGDVVPGIFGGGGLVPEDAVGKSGVLQIFPANIVEGFRTVRSA